MDFPDESTLLLTVESETENATSFSVFLTLAMSAVGAGCMALPYTFVAAGYMMGVLLLVFSAIICGLSLIGLAQLARRTGKNDYSEIADVILGPAGRVVAILGICLLLVGASACFIDISTDLLYPFAVEMGLPFGPYGTRILIAFVMALVSLPRTMHALRHVSLIGMVCLIYILLGVLHHTRGDGTSQSPQLSESVRAFRPGLGIVLAFNLQVMAYACHPNVPMLYFELRRDLKPKMDSIIMYTMGFAFIFYLLMSAGHFYVQHGHPSGNLLADYSSQDMMMTVAKCVLSIVLILKAPLVYRPLHSLVYSTLGRPPPSQLWGVIECFAVYAAFVVLTIYVPDLVTVMSWCGLTCGALISFILPGIMMFVDAGHIEPLDECSPNWIRGSSGRMFGALIAACGFFIMILGPFAIRATNN